MTTILERRRGIWCALTAAGCWAFAVSSGGCSVDEEATGASEPESVANGVQCEVDYTKVDPVATRGFRVIEPTVRKISEKERIRHLNELGRMPEPSKALFRTVPLAVQLTGGSIVEFAEYANLRGVTPRGWEGTGFTWDVVPGTASTTAVFLGDSAKPNNAYSLAVHEATHTVDLHLGLTATSPKLRASFQKAQTSPHGADSLTVYRLSNIQEYLAVAVDEYSCNATTRAALKRTYPDLFDYIERDLEGEVGARRR